MGVAACGDEAASLLDALDTSLLLRVFAAVVSRDARGGAGRTLQDGDAWLPVHLARLARVSRCVWHGDSGCAPRAGAHAAA